MPVKIYFMGNWHWWDCKEGRHDLICSQWMRGGGPDTDCAANKLDQRAAPNGGSSKGKTMINKVAVIGGSGFVGRATVERLARAGKQSLCYAATASGQNI